MSLHRVRSVVFLVCSLLAGAAAVTTRLRVGALVYGVDYRHPVIYAKQAASLHLLSGGRHEFGIGAGWMETDYQQAGMAYDSPGTRIERLEETLKIALGMVSAVAIWLAFFPPAAYRRRMAT